MDFKKYLSENIVILDGGMGTILQKKGLKPGEHPEEWNLSHSDIVSGIHKAYFDAGSNVVSTNTFGVNLIKYSPEEAEKLIAAAVNNCVTAKNKCTGTQKKYIAFDIGPLGKLLKPYGELGFNDTVDIFARCVQIAVRYEIDLFIIETMNDSYETKAALLAVKENSDLPVIVSNAYGEDGKLVTGASPEAMVAMLQSMGADAVGTNCSFGPEQSLGIVNRMLDVSSVPVILKPNAGLPVFIDGDTVYNVSPDVFADEISAAVNMGVRHVGGCCGTTPEYIAAVVDRIRNLTPRKTEKKSTTVVSSCTHTVVFDNKPILIGERINPTGKKRFKQALIENDIDYILNEGIAQQARGVDILDVNVGLAGINEPDVLEQVVMKLQAVCNLPLQLDSADPCALEKAMRVYNGKPLVNSVNGKSESMDAVFPLIKKYGGSVIALTLDENGIPDSAVERVNIAKRILQRAAEFDIGAEDIIFDPLTMTVSTSADNAVKTLETVSILTKELGVKTLLGVSNVSFGLPGREILNSTFFNMALCNGLSAAILNPYSESMMNVYYSYCALNQYDTNFVRFISYAQNSPECSSVSDMTENCDLSEAICRGMKDSAGRICREKIRLTDGLAIINEFIIPALDKTGADFEKGIIFLPQLLMSAEAASAAFDVIRECNSANNKNKCKIVLATVKGDVHDIGKNIVKLLLENYGYDVIDLGKDVSSEIIVNTVLREQAPIVGLSALMTTTLDAMKDTVKLLKINAPDCKVFVGGAVVNKDFAELIGADRYTKDAMESVRFAESVFNSFKNK